MRIKSERRLKKKDKMEKKVRKHRAWLDEADHVQDEIFRRRDTSGRKELQGTPCDH